MLDIETCAAALCVPCHHLLLLSVHCSDAMNFLTSQSRAVWGHTGMLSQSTTCAAHTNIEKQKTDMIYDMSLALCQQYLYPHQVRFEDVNS